MFEKNGVSSVKKRREQLIIRIIRIGQEECASVEEPA